MALTSRTIDQLNEIQTAIRALITGAQSVTLDGQTYTLERLNVLQDRERELYRRLTSKRVRKRTTPDFS
jgi:hypothetical protein